MAEFRNCSRDTRSVHTGVPMQTVEPDGILVVPDDQAFLFVHQPHIWEPADEAARNAVEAAGEWGKPKAVEAAAPKARRSRSHHAAPDADAAGTEGTDTNPEGASS